MKTRTATFMVLGIAMAAAQDAGRFLYLQEHAVVDARISSDAANALVREGVESGDPKVMDMIIRGLGNVAAVFVHDLPHTFGKLPERDFQAVSGLKPLLIEHWRKEHENVGHSTSEALRDSLGSISSDGVTVTFPSPAEWGLEVNDAGEAVNPEAVRETSRRTPPWLMIPQMLLVFWPGDIEVEQFLYEMGDIDTARNTTLTTPGPPHRKVHVGDSQRISDIATGEIKCGRWRVYGDSLGSTGTGAVAAARCPAGAHRSGREVSGGARRCTGRAGRLRQEPS